MTRVLHDKRQRQAIVLGAVSAVLLGAWAISGAIRGEPTPEPRAGLPVIADLEARFADASEVRITLPDDSYTLTRDASDGIWRLEESGGFPIRQDALADLFDGLAQLEYERARTADPDKFNSLGVGDPSRGESGARIRVVSQSGDTLADVIAGRRRDRTYVRVAEETRAWRVRGDLPPLYARSEWLDLNVARVPEDAISAVTVSFADGSGYRLAREGDQFAPAGRDSARALVSRFAASGPARALSRFSPLDVDRSDGRNDQLIGLHTTELTSGLRITLTGYLAPDQSGWVEVDARGGPPGLAEALNAQARGWRFRLSGPDFAELMTLERAVLRAPE